MAFLYSPFPPQPIYLIPPLEIYPHAIGGLGQPDMPDCLQATATAPRGSTTISIQPTGKMWRMQHGRYLNFVDPTTRKAVLVVLTSNIGPSDTSLSCEPLMEEVPAGSFVDYPYRFYGRLESSLEPDQNFEGTASLESSGFVAEVPTDFRYGGNLRVIVNDLDAALMQARYQADNNLPVFIRDNNPSPREGILGQTIEGNYYLGKPQEPKGTDTRTATFNLRAITPPTRIPPRAGDHLFGKILSVLKSGNTLTIYGHGLVGLTHARFGATLQDVNTSSLQGATAVTSNDGNKVVCTFADPPAGFISLTDGTRVVASTYARA